MSRSFSDKLSKTELRLERAAERWLKQHEAELLTQYEVAERKHEPRGWTEVDGEWYED